MIRVVRAAAWGSARPRWPRPARRTGCPRWGQWISASGTCPCAPGGGRSARSRRSECHQACPSAQAGAGLQPQPGGQDGADVRQPAQRGAGGGEPEPGGGHPVPGQPAPARPGPEPPGRRVPGPPPPGRDRGQPSGLRPQRGGEQVGRARRSAPRTAAARRCRAGTAGAPHRPAAAQACGPGVPAAPGVAVPGVEVSGIVVSWACSVIRFQPSRGTAATGVSHVRKDT